MTERLISPLPERLPDPDPDFGQKLERLHSSRYEMFLQACEDVSQAYTRRMVGLEREYQRRFPTHH